MKAKRYAVYDANGTLYGTCGLEGSARFWAALLGGRYEEVQS